MTSPADPRLVSRPQHAYEHRPKNPVLLAVDQEFGERASRAISSVRPMTSRNARRIVRGVNRDRGTSPEYPDIPPLYPRYFPTGLPPEHSQHDIERIAEEHSREDEALQEHKKPSLWKRLRGRRGHVTR
jgi:hypothetical protein